MSSACRERLGYTPENTSSLLLGPQWEQPCRQAGRLLWLLEGLAEGPWALPRPYPSGTRDLVRVIIKPHETTGLKEGGRQDGQGL